MGNGLNPTEIEQRTKRKEVSEVLVCVGEGNCDSCSTKF